MRNIETKARLRDLPAARQIAAGLATQRLGVQEQVDTYFVCPHGRLKLRQIEHQPANLIWYERPDQTAAKPSDYQLVPVSNPETLKAALAAAWGIRGVVRKRREIFLHHNVRIHLDEVEGLGPFLEFEAVLHPGLDDAAGEAQVEQLAARFAIRPEDLLPQSYSDMLLG